MNEKASSWLYVIGVALSLAISFLINCRETVINPDAICYLLSAKTVGLAGVSAAMHLCGQANWPFYPILIHGLHLILPFSYETVAYLLDALFTALSVALFVRIVQELGASRRVLWLALFTILLAHHFNGVRQYIIRDHGYWAFYLASVLFLLQYLRQPRLILALLWTASLMLAALFRIEGVFFLLAIPTVVLFVRSRSCWQRTQMFLSLNALTLLVGVGVLSWAILHPAQSISKMDRIIEIRELALHSVSAIHAQYQSAKLAMAEHVLNSFSKNDAGFFLLFMLVGMYIFLCVSNLTIGYALLVVYGWFSKSYKWPKPSSLVVLGYILVNFIITAAFMLELFFLSKRYLIGMSLMLMLFVPFALDDLLKRMQAGYQRILGSVVLLLVLLSAIGGLVDFGHSKSYIRDASYWMVQYLPKHSKLFTNDYQVFYYSQSPDLAPTEFFQRYQQMQNTSWSQYEYVAVRVNHHSTDEQKRFGNKSLKRLNEFSNKRGDKVIVYQVTDATNEERVQ